MKIDLNQCNKACHGCVKGYIKKHSIKKGDKLEISCTGIPTSYIPDSVAASLGTDPTMAIAMFDPVTWAAKLLDWHCLDPDGENWRRKTDDGSLSKLPKYDDEVYKERGSIFHRPYQAEMLRCSGKRKVFRIGRQAGKCLISGTQIHMADGSFKSIEHMQDGDAVLALNQNYEIVPAKAYLACNGEKQAAKLVLGDGREVSGSLNHPFLVRQNVGRETTGKRRAIFQDKWVELGKLRPGDWVAVPTKSPEGTEYSGSDAELSNLVLLGLLIADGNITSGNCRFSNQNTQILDYLKYHLPATCSLKHYDCDADDDYHIVGSGSGKQHQLKEWLKQIGLYGLDSHQKYLPDFVMRLSNQYLIPILYGMYGCDGWASVDKTGKPEVGYCTVSEKLANQLVAILSRFGIYATMRTKTVTLNGQQFFAKQIIITRQQDIVKFIEQIGLCGKEAAMHKTKLAALARKSSCRTDFYTENEVVFVRVKEIVDIGQQMTWDLTVPEHHNFIANNILSHNTEVLCISILHAMFTKQDFRIVVIAPFQSQIDLIFKRLNEMINNNVSLTNSIKRNVKAPNYVLELHNGSQVTGFTAGTRSGQDAGAARGQSAQMLVFDEADYLSAGDIDAALAIITNFPDATVWMSSTPTGRREKFYDNCYSKLFKEFHYSSYVNPNWTEETDALYREQLTEDGYKHEVLAEFGEQEEGVYQARYVEQAQGDYEYGQYKFNPTWTYMMGADWNDVKIGTTVAVIGFNPNDNNFYLVDKAIVTRAEWTQLAACQKIAEMNRMWNASAIYVDQGYGATQVEVLQEFGARMTAQLGPNHPDSRLRTIVKPFDFGGKIEIRDLFTGQPIKKPSKPFLVENSVRRFESCAFKYPASDKSYTAQLLGYIIDRVSVSGAPVYKAQNEVAGDHFLDAVNLALMAFTLEKSKFGKPIYSTQVAFAGRFGQGREAGKPMYHTFSQQAQEHKPAGGRASVMDKDVSLLKTEHGDLPAANTTVESSTRLWNWPGWGSDAPRPNPPSPQQKWQTAQQKPYRRKRPRRAKF